MQARTSEDEVRLWDIFTVEFTTPNFGMVAVAKCLINPITT